MLPYTSEQCEQLRNQLLHDPEDLTCPVHEMSMTIRQTLSWRRRGALTEDHIQVGWPSADWTVRRALVWCDRCHFEESVLLEMPVRAPRPTPTTLRMP